MQPSLTVGIPFHKSVNPKFLEMAVKSIINQSLKPDVIHLIQDGEITSELNDVVSQFEGENIKKITFQQNQGLACVLNYSIKEASTKYYARMDADDIAQSDRFFKQIQFLQENHDIDIVGSYCFEIDANNNKMKLRKMPVVHQDIYNNLFTSPFIHPTVMFKKSIIAKAGWYDETLKRRQDYSLWFKCAKAGAKFANIDEPLLLYRFTADTHKKQNFNLMLSQGKIGFRGVRSLNQSYFKAIACYIPLFRSLLPYKVQHIFYKMFKMLDPRQK